jgi:3-dehydroquinate synthase
LEIQTGEEAKTIDNCSYLWTQLSNRGAEKKSLLINLGGGVVTDLGGFVASTFKRGIEFVNIPTSLLAMVDAAIGGKNGVDLGILKNQIGVVRNPLTVIIDTEFLKTLPIKQLISGYAEMLKHGLIHSETYWDQLIGFDFSNPAKMEALIWKSVEIKNSVVTKDPFEKDLRKTLNYGHTLGHAIESYLLNHATKPSLLHGEAIAIGMILATFLSSELLSFPQQKRDAVTELILKNFPKTDFNTNDISEITKLLIYDKKNSNGKVNFVLLRNFGNFKIDCEVPNSLIVSAFDYYKNF